MPASETITLTRTTPIPGEESLPEVVVPRQLGSVTLVRELGRGGMGVVWLAHDEMLDRDVAVKFMLSAVSAADDPRFTTFLAGAKAAAAVRHPNLTSILHAGLMEEHGGIPFLVMEYVDGPSASQLMHARGPLPLAAALTVIEGACLATAELHAKEIVHRDLKPGNIMLSTAGGIFVTDFGLALARQAGAARSGSARLSIAGSPPYMAPEMFDGEVSSKTDVYALGVTLHELLTGDVPFGGTFEDLERLHRHAAIPHEKLQQFKTPEPLIEVIERATHKNALFRYRSAEHLRGAIRLACPRPDQWSRGSIELAALLGGNTAPPAKDAPEAPDATPHGTYYDAIGSRARQRRQELESTREEIDAERRLHDELRRDEERRVSEAIERRRGEAVPSVPGSLPLPPDHRSTGRPASRATPTPAAPSAAPPPTSARCQQCGYALAGITAPTDHPAQPTCPECGAPFDPSGLWSPAPWPSPPLLGLRLCGPMALASITFVILSIIPAVRNLGVWPLSLTWLVVFAVLAIVLPIDLSRRLGRERLCRSERAAIVRQTSLLAITANLVVGAVTFMSFWLLISRT